MQVSDIHTINWQLGLAFPTAVVEGMDDVKQCMNVILKTRKGEDPLRPHFGCDLFDWIDRPLPTAIPNMKMIMLEALNRYEPRVRVQQIRHRLKSGHVLFDILYKFPDGSEDIFELSTADLAGQIDGGATPATLVLQAVYTEGFRYHVSLILDGEQKTPFPPAQGFASAADLFAWVVDNWSFYGDWRHIASQKLITLTVLPGMGNSGSLSITATDNVLSAEIPALPEGQSYDVIFINPGNTRVQPLNPEDTQTNGQILSFVQSEYASYGSWTIENNILILDGSVDLTGYQLLVNTFEPGRAFSEGFDTGFDA